MPPNVLDYTHKSDHGAFHGANIAVIRKWYCRVFRQTRSVQGY